MGLRVMASLRHIALFVPDLRAAEAYYQPLFEMRLIGREARLDDGLWHTLPFNKSCDEAEAAGIVLGMLALQMGDFVLALFQGDAPPGQVFAIGLNLLEDETARVRCVVEMNGPEIGGTKVGEGCPQVRVAISADADRFEQLFLGILNSAPPKKEKLDEHTTRTG